MERCHWAAPRGNWRAAAPSPAAIHLLTTAALGGGPAQGYQTLRFFQEKRENADSSHFSRLSTNKKERERERERKGNNSVWTHTLANLPTKEDRNNSPRCTVTALRTAQSIFCSL